VAAAKARYYRAVHRLSLMLVRQTQDTLRVKRSSGLHEKTHPR
jgi:hypothetical protein